MFSGRAMESPVGMVAMHPGWIVSKPTEVTSSLIDPGVACWGIDAIEINFLMATCWVKSW